MYFTLLMVFNVLATTQECEFGPTSCTCSYNAASGTCYKPVTATGCIAVTCTASWRCDCLRPTHMCSRVSCTQFQPAEGETVPDGADTRCHAITNATCVQVRGSAIEPLSELVSMEPLLTVSPTSSVSFSPSSTASPTILPSASTSPAVAPSDTPSTFSCTQTSECLELQGGNSLCILGGCVEEGSCNEDMRSYCAALYNDATCCDKNTACSSNLVHDNTALCNTDCSSSCFESNNVFPCAFRSGGSTIGLVPTSGGAVPGSPLSECPVIF